MNAGNHQIDRIQLALERYLAILNGSASPRFKSADLDSKTAESFRMLESCSLCGRDCGANRAAGEKGVCRAGNRMQVSSAFDHHGEEFFFVPSFTVFFPNCTFSCCFCQNWDISQGDATEVDSCMSETGLAAAIDNCGSCKNVNFVGGEPTPWLPFILKTLKNVTKDIPVIWNSNFYMSDQSMNLLEGVVDVYLSDLKYGNDQCAERLSGVSNYSKIVRKNHLLAVRDAEMVIRHLVLPNHIECCTKPALGFVAEKLGTRVVVNLMDQYRPCYKANEYADINRRVTRDEFGQCTEYADSLGLNFIT